jgi:NADH:ubiquinone oxidoreductase subunit 5 (subunit L)/multisubunit Na+/H+ antiporter MnhA subunit
MNEILKIPADPGASEILQNLIFMPLVAGVLLFLVPRDLRFLKGILTLIISVVSCCLAISLYDTPTGLVNLLDINTIPDLRLFGFHFPPELAGILTFNIDPLARLILLFIAFFAVLITFYSLAYIGNQEKIDNYYGYILITLGASFGAVLSDHLLLFVFFWGILGITLYKLIRGYDDESSATAEKTLIMIGASDGVMILGIAIYWKLTGSLSISGHPLETDGILPTIAFLFLLAGSFTKAGAFPFHTWLPDFARFAPASSSAYLPASLDKLLGIYFLARITGDLFIMNGWLRFFLLLTGVVTIITAVMMALVQHNYKRLLGYHAVSQVGYMVLGFGLGSVPGIAAGLFHMINHALYKSGLLLSAGCIEYRTGKDNIDDLGGLSGSMPVTFITALIFALSISGIPPLNGFASKWMIYQAIVDSGNGSGLASELWMVWLGLAVAGSALTLASFIKFIGGIFLSRQKAAFEKIREVPFLMWLPLVILAVLCILFGVFSSGYVVPWLFMPITGSFEFTGIWQSELVTLMVLVSIVLGILIYLLMSIKNFRMEDSFIGGEKMQDTASFGTPEFYKTIGEFRFFAWFYQKAEKKWFDLYDILKKGILWCSHLLSRAHSGLLQDYAIWIFAGLILMLIVLI